MKAILKHFVLMVFLLSAGSFAVKSQDWPQWRGENRDGKAPGFMVPDNWTGELKEIWRTSVGTGDATPALVNDQLYVFTRQDGKEVLLCLDARTGKEIWKSAGYPAAEITGPAASHPGPRSSPAVSEGKVITLGIGGDIACFDAANGNLKWRFEEYKGQVPRFNTGMSPIVVKGMCIANLGGPESGYYIALDLESGKVIWKTAGEGPPYGSPVLMTLGNNLQVVFQAQTKIMGLNAKNGDKLWEFPTPAGEGRVNNASSPVVVGNIIYHTGLNNGLNAVQIINRDDGFQVQKLWSNPDISTSFNTPVYKDGFLYGINNRGKLFCVNAENGQTAWIDEYSNQNLGSVVDAGTVIVALSGKSELIVFKPDPNVYSQSALIKVSDTPVYAHPVLSGNRIFVKDSDSVVLYSPGK